MKRINIAFMKFNSAGASCTTSLSQTAQMGLYSTSKKNEGFGEESSDESYYLMPQAFVYDQDICDDNACWFDSER